MGEHHQRRGNRSYDSDREPDPVRPEKASNRWRRCRNRVPVVGAAVVVEQDALFLPVRQGICVLGWRVLDRLPCQIDRHGSIEPADIGDT